MKIENESKIMLMVDEKDVESFFQMVNISGRRGGRNTVIRAKSDAQAEIERIKREVAEECLDWTCGWCNGEGVTIEAGEEGQAIQSQCRYCQATGVDYNKLNMLKAKYGIGEK